MVFKREPRIFISILLRVFVRSVLVLNELVKIFECVITLFTLISTETHAIDSWNSVYENEHFREIGFYFTKSGEYTGLILGSYALHQRQSDHMYISGKSSSTLHQINLHL